MLTMGFMGSLHCIGMCGGLLTAVSFQREKSHWLGLWFYQWGRISTYTFLGFILGILGTSLMALGGDLFQRAIAMLAGFLMIIFALNLAGFLPDPVRHFTAWVMSKIGLITLLAKLSAYARLRNWYVLGLVNGLLPCGLVYAALAMSLAQGQWLDASIAMASFGIGTIPAMMLAPIILQKIRPQMRLFGLRVAAGLMLGLGVLTLMRGINPMHMMPL